MCFSVELRTLRSTDARELDQQSVFCSRGPSSVRVCVGVRARAGEEKNTGLDREKARNRRGTRMRRFRQRPRARRSVLTAGSR